MDGWQAMDYSTSRYSHCPGCPIDVGILLNQPGHPQDQFLLQVWEDPGDDRTFEIPTSQHKLSVALGLHNRSISQRQIFILIFRHHRHIECSKAPVADVVAS